jgi:uncharacterized protein YgiM (DUF1202 family)
LYRTRFAALLIAGALVFVSVGASLPAAAVETKATATVTLNIRSQPSLEAAIVGSLYRGQVVTAVSASDGWTRIRFSSSTAYVASRYLTAGPALPDATAVNSGAVRVATTDLNLRKGPGLSYELIVVLRKGTPMTLSGKTARGYAEVTAGTRRGWAGLQYLASPNTLPRVVGVRVTTRSLAIRTTSGGDYKTVEVVKKGTQLSVTGTTQNGRAQIVYKQAVRWVSARYLANPQVNQPTVPKLPKVTGTRYATATLLVRSSSADTYAVITEVPKGTPLSITGVTQNGRAQIIWVGAVRWVNAKYLSATPPSTGGSGTTNAIEKGLGRNAIKLYRGSRAAFPQVRTYYGRRPGTGSDHNVGNALDIMLPNYKSASGRALGNQIAAWTQANKTTFNVTYVIWNQRIWSVRRASEGWRPMASRGSDSANHIDHVHVSVAP